MIGRVPTWSRRAAGATWRMRLNHPTTPAGISTGAVVRDSEIAILDGKMLIGATVKFCFLPIWKKSERSPKTETYNS